MSTQRESTQPLLHHASPLRGSGSGAPFLGRTLSLQREVLAKEERKCAALKLMGGVGGSTLLFFGTLFAFEGIGPTGRIWWMLMVMVGALLDLLVQLSAALQRLQRERELSRTKAKFVREKWINKRGDRVRWCFSHYYFTDRYLQSCAGVK